MTKRTMPIKTFRLELDGDYQDWWLSIRTNPPVGILLDAIVAFQQAQTEDSEDMRLIMPPLYRMLELVVQEWNFVDEKGKELPATLEGLRKLPIDLIITLADKVQEVVVGLPLASSAG